MDQFVNRIDELERLQALYESDAAELAIIYGRRQIGKSELVRQSIVDRDDAVYYQAVQGTATTQLRRFVEAAATTYPDITAVKEEWEPLLTYLTDRDAIIVIDEFPYLIESNEGLPSVIQHLWDTAVEESQATLVLTGSAIGMIHTHVLDGGAPLYGRVSQTPNGRLELTQLPFRSIQEFVPTYDPKNGCSSMASSAAHPDISALSIHHRVSEKTSRGCCATWMVHSTTSPKPSSRWSSTR